VTIVMPNRSRQTGMWTISARCCYLFSKPVAGTLFHVTAPGTASRRLLALDFFLGCAHSPEIEETRTSDRHENSGVISREGRWGIEAQTLMSGSACG
jgi:hypothetical protein